MRRSALLTKTIDKLTNVLDGSVSIGRIGYSTLIFSWRQEKEPRENVNETSENLTCPVAGSIKSH